MQHGLDLIKGLKQIKSQRLLLTCAPIFELPPNITDLRQLIHVLNDSLKEKRKVEREHRKGLKLKALHDMTHLYYHLSMMSPWFL